MTAKKRIKVNYKADKRKSFFSKKAEHINTKTIEIVNQYLEELKCSPDTPENQDRILFWNKILENELKLKKLRRLHDGIK